MRNKSLMRLAVCLIGMAAMVLQGCSESGTDRDKLCGSWSSVEGKPDVLVYKEGEAYKVTVFARSLGRLRVSGLRPTCWLRRTGTCSSTRGTASTSPTTRPPTC